MQQALLACVSHPPLLLLDWLTCFLLCSRVAGYFWQALVNSISTEASNTLGCTDGIVSKCLVSLTNPGYQCYVVRECKNRHVRESKQ